MPSPLESLVQGFQENQASQERQAKNIASQQADQWERQYRLDQAQQQATYQSGLLANQQTNAGIRQGKLTLDEKTAADKEDYRKQMAEYHKGILALGEKKLTAGNDTALQKAAINGQYSIYRTALVNAASPEQAREIATAFRTIHPNVKWDEAETPETKRLQGLSPGTALPAPTGASGPAVTGGAPASPPVNIAALLQALHANTQAAGQGAMGTQMAPPTPVPAVVNNQPLAPTTNVLDLLSGMEKQRQANLPTGPQAVQRPAPDSGAPAYMQQPLAGALAKNDWYTSRAGEQRAAAEKTRAQTAEIPTTASADRALKYASAAYLRAGTAGRTITNQFTARKTEADIAHTVAATAAALQNATTSAGNLDLARRQFSYKVYEDALNSDEDSVVTGAAKEARAALSTWGKTKQDLMDRGSELARQMLENRHMAAPGYLEGLKNNQGAPMYSPQQAQQERGLLEQKYIQMGDALNTVNQGRKDAIKQYDDIHSALEQAGKLNQTTAGGAPKKSVAAKVSDAQRAIGQGLRPVGIVPPGAPPVPGAQPGLYARPIERQQGVPAAKKKPTAADVKKKFGL